jgi:predicted RNA-binding protein with PIN domain
MLLLVDGYNLLWAVKKLTEQESVVTDVRMCWYVNEYLRKIKQMGEMIFDGVGPPDKRGFDGFTNLEIIFSGRDIEADTVIENKIRINSAPKGLTVISSDRRVRDAAKTRRAISIKAEDFWLGLTKELEKKERIKEPKQKRHGLTDGETDYWLKEFEMDE